MNETPENNTPAQKTQNNIQRVQSPHEKNQAGPMVGIAIIVVVIALGGLYFWGKALNTNTLQQDQEQAGAQTQALQQQGESDELSDIESDIENTNLEGLDAELEDIEAELGL